MLNALERLCNAYATEIGGVKQDLSIAESQLRDYQACIGKPFIHDAYQVELTQLRDQLKASLVGIVYHATSQKSSEAGAKPPPSTAELAHRIKSSKVEHTIDATPERAVLRRTDAEEPVTARIRRKSEASSQRPLPPTPMAPPSPRPSLTIAGPTR